jgi:hypothetical protein
MAVEGFNLDVEAVLRGFLLGAIRNLLACVLAAYQTDGLSPK